MAQITAAMVKELRETTGAGMMDCKAALNETNGDMEAAIDWLRAKGLSKAAKKASRVAAEGLVGVAVSGNTGAAVEVVEHGAVLARQHPGDSGAAEEPVHPVGRPDDRAGDPIAVDVARENVGINGGVHRELGARTGGIALVTADGLDDAAFRARFSGSPIKRIGRDRMVRNVLYAIGNSGEARLRSVAQSLSDDPDAAVRDAARWAVGCLAL